MSDDEARKSEVRRTARWLAAGAAVVLVIAGGVCGAGAARSDDDRGSALRFRPAPGGPLDEDRETLRQRNRGRQSREYKETLREAIRHARKAERAGERGDSDALVHHSWRALDRAKDAQRAGHSERINDGVYALGEAIEHGEHEETEDATDHVRRAIMKLSQAAGTQLPEDFPPERVTPGYRGGDRGEEYGG